jgi:hypothetical protein
MFGLFLGRLACHANYEGIWFLGIYYHRKNSRMLHNSEFAHRPLPSPLKDVNINLIKYTDRDSLLSCLHSV